MIVAELVDGCRLKCSLCWNRDRRGSFKNMSLDMVDKVLDKYGDEPSIDWHNWGEPLLHKKFFEVAQLVKGTNSRISSSLSMPISGDKFEAIHNFELITVSLSGMTEKIYNIYHRGGDFDLVISNLLKIVSGKKNDIRVQWLAHLFNVHEQYACLVMCKKLGIGFSSKGLNCEVESQAEGFQHGLLKGYRWDRKKCYVLDDIVIGVDGQYLLCCSSHNVEIGLHIDDNVSKEEIIEAKLKTDLCQECQRRGLWKMY